MDFSNIWRIIVMTICAVSFFIMIIGFSRHRKAWNNKTRDYWYGRVMWVVSGFVIALEGMLEGSHDTYGLVFITAAAVATLKGNVKKGSWGNQND